MATKTENIGLTQAAGTEYYSVEVVNENLAKIDASLGELQAAVGAGTGGTVGDKVGNFDDSEEGTIFGDLNTIKDQVEQNGVDIAETKEFASGNSTKLDAMKTTVDNTKTIADLVNTQVETIKQNTESLMQSSEGIVAKVEDINANVSENGTAISDLDSKADVISGNVQMVGENVSTVKTDVASVKAIVESTSGKADTAVELLNMLKALATAKTKQLICCKGIAKNSEWQTVVNITGNGVLEKAFARSYTEGGYVRITIDDEIVLLTKTAYHDVVGAIKDAVWSNDAIQTVITTSSGSFMWGSIKQNGAWHIGFPGSVEKSYGCMCLIPNGIRFAKNFKFEVKAMETGVTVTGEISEDSEVTTL